MQILKTLIKKNKLTQLQMKTKMKSNTKTKRNLNYTLFRDHQLKIIHCWHPVVVRYKTSSVYRIFISNYTEWLYYLYFTFTFYFLCTWYLFEENLTSKAIPKNIVYERIKRQQFYPLNAILNQIAGLTPVFYKAQPGSFLYRMKTHIHEILKLWGRHIKKQGK